VEFIETPLFVESIKNILDDEDVRALQNFLIQNPEAGDVVPGMAGLRKIRHAAKGHGKRGGARIIYLFIDVRNVIFLVFAYAKNTKLDLTTPEKKAFAQMVKELKRLP
jgi:hypothetical protein